MCGRCETLKLYSATFACPHCGRTHQVAGAMSGLGLLIEHGPAQAGTVAELYAGRELPKVLRSLLNDKVWCDQTGEYVLIGDPTRVLLRPIPEVGE
jgi:hypothetical protein